MGGILLTIKLVCPKHKGYTGRRPYTKGCNDCESLWIARNQPEMWGKQYVFSPGSCKSVDIADEFEVDKRPVKKHAVPVEDIKKVLREG